MAENGREAINLGATCPSGMSAYSPINVEPPVSDFWGGITMICRAPRDSLITVRLPQSSPNRFNDIVCIPYGCQATDASSPNLHWTRLTNVIISAGNGGREKTILVLW